MDSDVMDRCFKMVGAIFSRTSSSRRRDTNPQVVDVIRAVPNNGALTKEATGAYKAGIWVWDVAHARTSPRMHRPKQGESDVPAKDDRKCHSMERSVGHTGEYPHLNFHHTDANSVTRTCVTSRLENDVKHASLSKRPQPPSTPSENTDVREKYMTLPQVITTSTRRTRRALTTVTRNPNAEDSGASMPSQNVRKPKDDEVRRLAKSMVHSIENLMENLQGILGDLRQLVQQIDAVTDSIDFSCNPSLTHHQGSIKKGLEHTPAFTSTTTFTQTDPDQHSRVSLSRSECVRKSDSVHTSPSHRYSYPQYYHCPHPNIPISSPGFSTERKMCRKSRSSTRPGDGSHTAPVTPKSSNPQQESYIHRRGPCDNFSDVRHLDPPRIRQRPRVFSGAPFIETIDQSLIQSMSRNLPECSMPFVPLESPPNPAPTIFSAYREESASQTKDSDSLPDTGLKTWKEKTERRCGSADSLTPQMDWSYLVLTDQHLSTRREDLKRSNNSHDVDSLSSRKDRSRLKLSAHNSDAQRSPKDRSRLSQAGMRIKHQVGAIPRIPEQGELCDTSYDDNSDVFTYMETFSSMGSASAKWAGGGLLRHVKQGVDISPGGQSTDDGPQTACGISQDTGSTGVFPQVQQSIGGASLGWNTSNKALPNWPSEDLSYIGASDNEVDGLSSPFLQQHFQYPRRSSAVESSPEKTDPEVDNRMNRTSSVPETIASGGFEVRADIETSPESDVLGTYAGQYETAMESRLEQLSNEVEGSDFSDADADVGSDVLEQSLTSLEDTPGARYDRELNTWTSYTMTHIDSDDVVSECTSDILNENLFEIATTNPGFDDVSLNFDDIGYLPLPLKSNTLGNLSPSLR